MKRRLPVPVSILALVITALACNMPGASDGQTVTPGGPTEGGSTEAATDAGPNITAAPVCTPPACQPGETLICTGGDCPGGCGISCVAATATSSGPTPVTTSTPSTPNAGGTPFVSGDGSFKAEFQGISFYIPYTISGNWQVETIPADQFDVNIANWWVASHYKFTLPGYPTANTIQPPRILIWPVKNWLPEYSQEANRRIAELTALANKPETIDLSKEIPVLPVFNAAQAIRSQVAPLAFQNGKGIRFVTYYSQAPMAVNNAEAFYTFQGVTSDGLYYIAAYFPITHPSLVATNADVPGGDINAFTANYTQYLADITKTLNDATQDSYAPDLSDLDYIIQSMLIGK